MAKFSFLWETNGYNMLVEKIVVTPIDGVRNSGARLAWRDFAGAQYGNQCFGLIIDDLEFGDQLAAKNWNVKLRPPREEGDPAIYTLPVTIKWRNRDGSPARPVPKVGTKSDGRMTMYTEQTTSTIDGLRLDDITIKIEPYAGWDRNDPEKKAAHCETFYATVVIDELDRKWLSEAVQDETLPF